MRQDIYYRDNLFNKNEFPIMYNERDSHLYLIPKTGDYVNKGDVIAKIRFTYSSKVIKELCLFSEYDGYALPEKNLGSGCSLESLFWAIRENGEKLLISLFSSLDDLKDFAYPFHYTIQKDAFTSEPIIQWDCIAGHNTTNPSLSGLLISGMPYLRMSFQIHNQRPYLYIYYSHKLEELYLHKNDTISFKFSDGSVKTYTISSTPQLYNKDFKYVCVLLTKTDIFWFKDNTWTLLRFNNETGASLRQYSNHLFYLTNRKDAPSESVSILSQLVFRDYSKAFYSALIESNIDLDKIILNEEQEQKATCDICYVYLMKDVANGYYKIGISNNPEYRERTLQSEKPTIEKICAKQFPSRLIAQSIESALHSTFASQRIRGEWFNLSEEEVAQIIETLQ